MKNTHNTPALRTVEAPLPALTLKENLYRLEDRFRDYRKDAAAGYFKEDKAEVAKFLADIAAARAAL